MGSSDEANPSYGVIARLPIIQEQGGQLEICDFLYQVGSRVNPQVISRKEMFKWGSVLSAALYVQLLNSGSFS